MLRPSGSTLFPYTTLFRSIVFRALVFSGQFVERRHKRLRHKHPAVRPEVAACIGDCFRTRHKGRKRLTPNVQRPTFNSEATRSRGDAVMEPELNQFYERQTN